MLETGLRNYKKQTLRFPGSDAPPGGNLKKCSLGSYQATLHRWHLAVCTLMKLYYIIKQYL